jgi:hypothetical protein
MRYQHTQRGTTILACLLAGALVCGLVATRDGAPRLVLVGLIIILVACAYLFGSLTVVVTEDALGWHFGPGAIRKAVQLTEVQGAELATTRLWHGWGIHWTPRGWLYNVSGFRAVAVRLRDGREILLGTDDAERLRTAILRALA